jgi:hypothetical protein
MVVIRLFVLTFTDNTELTSSLEIPQEFIKQNLQAILMILFVKAPTTCLAQHRSESAARGLVGDGVVFVYVHQM